MKDITFNTTSWHYRLYKRAYDTTKLPDNLCPYFWKVAFVIVTLPISWICVLVNWSVPYTPKLAMGIVMHLVLAAATIIGCVINMDVLHWWTDPYWIGYTILGVVFLALVLLCMFIFFSTWHTPLPTTPIPNNPMFNCLPIMPPN